MIDKQLNDSQYNIVSWIFTRLIGLVYLIAFFSFSRQALGLIGSHGISPLSQFTELVQHQLGTKSYFFIPMIFWFDTSDLFIQGVCWAGLFFSLLLILNILPRVSLIFLYILYLSLIYAGQSFMSYQWDLFLLETGVFTCILLTMQTVGVWLLRWLLFRFIFVAGIVKIFSGDPAWHQFTALSYYFETEPLPTPLAWYAYQLPQSFLSFGSMATLVIELCMPFLIFAPRRIRFISAFFILLLQVTILITGNYNFFNILTIVLCLILFDDAALKKIIPKRLVEKKLTYINKPYLGTKIVVGIFSFILVFVSCLQLYARLGGSVSESVISAYEYIAPLRMVNLYGPFAVVTKERMEIIIEGSDDGINWKEYQFKYKPGDIFQRPLWNIPFQPRLDWQMWFAALSSPEQNPWFISLLQRLLENSPEVILLLKDNPFPTHPPRYIQAQFYEYKFTTPEIKKQTGAWWERRLVRSYSGLMNNIAQ